MQICYINQADQARSCALWESRSSRLNYLSIYPSTNVSVYLKPMNTNIQLNTVYCNCGNCSVIDQKTPISVSKYSRALKVLLVNNGFLTWPQETGKEAVCPHKCVCVRGHEAWALIAVSTFAHLFQICQWKSTMNSFLTERPTSVTCIMLNALLCTRDAMLAVSRS